MAQLTTRQHLIATLAFTKADGTSGEVNPGSVAVASSDAAVLTATILPDGTVDVAAVAAGAATFTVTAETAAGQISGTSEPIDVVVDPRDGAATTVAITLEPPADKPVP